MHIPDGFISPKLYLPLYGVSAGLWVYSLKRVKRELDESALPHLAVLTALAFVLMLLTIPLPGGTSVHAMGVGLLAVIFGVWTTFLAISLVLLLQALLLGDGGVTSLPVNAIAMGFIGSLAACCAYRAIRGANETVALFAAGWLSINVAAFAAAIALGIQPSLAHGADGTPLFFPFGLSITLPAVMIPHALIGIGEGVLTVLVFQFVSKLTHKATS
ncbi:MAG: energy-coupling factor ABC transporter permease [Candidatus Latescibacterota bacterium]